MLEKHLIRTERTEIRPVDGKTRGRALGYLEKQIEGRDSSMCAGCEDRVQENRPSLSLRSLNVITRGNVEALRVRSIKLTQKDFAAQPRARSVAPIPMATASQLDSRHFASESFRMSYYSVITAL